MASNGGSQYPPDPVTSSEEKTYFVFTDNDSSQTRVEAHLLHHKKLARIETKDNLLFEEAAAAAAVAAEQRLPAAVAVAVEVASTTHPPAAEERESHISFSKVSQVLQRVEEEAPIQERLSANGGPTHRNHISEQIYYDQFGNTYTRKAATNGIGLNENVKPSVEPATVHQRIYSGRPSTIDPNDKYDKHYIRPPIHRRKQIEAARLALDGVSEIPPLTNGTNQTFPNGKISSNKLTHHTVNGLGRPAITSMQPPGHKTVPRVPQQHHPPSTQNGRIGLPQQSAQHKFDAAEAYSRERAADREKYLAREAVRRHREADLVLAKQLEEEKKEEEEKYNKMVEENKAKMKERLDYIGPTTMMICNEEAFEMPSVLLQHVGLLKQILCAPIYAQLPYVFRKHLKQFLPDFEEFNVDDEIDVLDKAFSREPNNIHGKPVAKLFQRWQAGLYRVDKLEERKKAKAYREMIYQHRMRFRNIELLNDLLKARNIMIEAGRPPDQKMKEEIEAEFRKEYKQDAKIKDRVNRRTKLMFSDFRFKAGDHKETSSDEDDIPQCSMNKHLMTSMTRSTAFSVEGSRDLDLHQDYKHDDVPTMLRKHIAAKRKRPNSQHPVYDTSDMKLEDVYLRAGVLQPFRKIKTQILGLEKDVPKGRGFPEIKRLPLD